jgi:hypothetical protein
MQSVPITTKVVSSNSIHWEVYSIQHYVIKFVSDLGQVSGYLPLSDNDFIFSETKNNDYLVHFDIRHVHVGKIGYMYMTMEVMFYNNTNTGGILDTTLCDKVCQ